MEVLDKYSGEKIGEIQLDNRAAIDEKINNAHVFFQKFKNADVEIRRTWITAMVDVLKKHKTYLTDLIAKEAGKPLFYAKVELDRCIRTSELGLNYFDLLAEHKAEIDLSGTTFTEGVIKRYPVGVIFGISPFNFPLNLALHKIIPALAAGNPILIKPSPYTPLSLIFLIEEFNKVVSETGLLTVVNCSNEDAEYIVKHPLINLVSFTGSDKVGWHIKSLIPKKKVILELGGNAAVYVDDSADLKGLALTIAKAATLYAGQICISTQRVFVHENLYDSFKEELIEAFKGISSGNPFDNVTNGPLIDHVHLERLLNWINKAEKKHQKILVGGNKISDNPAMLSPTLVECTNMDIELFQEEAFGPVAVLQKVRDYQEAAACINNSRYGLQAGVYTNNESVMDYMFEHLDVGGLIINGVPGFRKDEMPYGGIKDSGFGREGIRYAIEEMTELKLCIR